MPILSTGAMKVPSPMLRIKVLAAPAGLSLQPALWKVPGKFPQETSRASPSSSLWIAPGPMATFPAAVALWTVPSDTMNRIKPCLSLTTPTLLCSTGLAQMMLQRVLLALPPSTTSLRTPISLRLPSMSAPSPSPSRLTKLCSKTTCPALSPATLAEPTLITVFLLSVTALLTARNSSLSRTLGAPHGAMRVTSVLALPRVPVFVVLTQALPSPLSERSQ